MAARGKPKRLDPEGLWRYSLNALGRRAHSVHELRQKLLRRADSAAAVTATIEKLHSYGLIDDAKFAESLATSRLHNQGFGQARVWSELRAKRVAANLAEPAIQTAYAETNENDLIRGYVDRKYRGKDLAALLQDPKFLNSVYRRLRLAGFSSNSTLTFLKSYAKEIDELSVPEDESLD